MGAAPLLHEAVWRDLPYHGFDSSRLSENRIAWEATAREVISRENEGHRVALIAPTAAGKTIVSLLVPLATGQRMLLFVPQKVFAMKHQELFNQMTGGIVRTRVITGETRQKDRIWTDERDRLVIATPETVISELGVKPSLLTSFGRITYDEFHHGTRDHAYAKLGSMTRSIGCTILGLSASPGSHRDMIREVWRTFGFTCFLWMERHNMPPCTEVLAVAEPDATLGEGIAIFSELMAKLAEETAGALAQIFVKTEIDRGRIPESSLEAVAAELAAIPEKERSGMFYEAATTFAKYRKAEHAHRTLVTGSYESFLRYGSTLYREDKSRAAARLVREDLFLKAGRLVKNAKLEHPKVALYKRAMLQADFAGWRTATFVNNKTLGLVLKEKLAKENLAIAETLFGGTDKNMRKLMEVLGKMSQGNVKHALTTSLLEEAVTIAEVRIYSYNPPQTPIAWIQRRGRTGRTGPGYFWSCLTNHPMEWAMYMSITSRVKGLKRMLIEMESEDQDAPALEQLHLF